MFDAHMHFYDNETGCNIDNVINASKSAGVDYFISNSIDLDTSIKNIELTKNYNSVYSAIGMYPLDIKNNNSLKEIDKIFDLYSNQKEDIKKKLMIGEIGLDFKFVNESQKDIQKKGFERQIEFAKENNLFMQIHSRYAISNTIKVLEEKNAKNVIMHWYTDSKKYIKRATDLGYYITLGPTYLTDHERIYNNIKDIDPKFILFETDFPLKFGEEIQYPSKIIDIAKKYAKDIEIEFEEIERFQDKAFKEIFNI